MVLFMPNYQLRRLDYFDADRTVNDESTSANAGVV
jgi:hypothetical protein